MLNTLRRIIQEVNGAKDFSETLRVLVARVREAMGTQVCSVYLFDAAANRYVLMATEGLRQESVGHVSLGVAEGLIGQVGLREEPINLEDAFEHPKFHYLAETGEEDYHAFLGVPVIHHGKVLGILVIQQQEVRLFDQSEEAFLVTISAQLSGVVAHALATGGLVQAAGGGVEGTYTGVAGASGAAIGEAIVVYPAADLASVPDRAAEDIDDEVAKLDSALIAVRSEVRTLRERVLGTLGPEEQALFDVYLRMLDRNALGGEIADAIREGQWAQGALKQVIQEHIQAFERMDDAYLRERASDVRDLGLRVLAQLQKKQTRKVDYPEQAILVADDISATTLMELPLEKVKGIVTLSGAANSHMAIVARTLGIPTVVGCLTLPLNFIEGRELVIDGFRGRVVVAPNASVRDQYAQIIEQEQVLVSGLESVREKPSITTDGYSMPLMVNTGLLADVTRSLAKGSSGVGLYRTEIPFMVRDRFPAEKEQARIYRSQLEAFHPHPVTMRTLDIGGDKSLPYFPIEEANPFLGWRGIRVTLDHPEIFMLQVRAMLKASEGFNNLRIMLPMVSNVFEAEEAMHLIHRAYLEVREEGVAIELPPVGVMIEVPSAVYQARELAQRADFLSVGSNDLTQYMLAVDRNNAAVARLYHGYHPAVFMALQQVVEAGHLEDKPVGICGELAGDPAAALLLMAMGFDSLSMSATQLLKVKWVLRNTSLEFARDMLKEVNQMDNSAVIGSYLDLKMQQVGMGDFLVRRGGEI